jgi:flagellar biosynthesis protein FlhG
MFDQASELRNLVLRAARDAAPAAGPRPRIVVFSGGKGGVGVTTLAINIAVTMVGHGMRVVLVDADLYRADVAPLCRLPERGDVGDILTARRDIHEVLERGPGGILVVPGVWAPEHEIPFSRHAQHRLIRQIRALGRHADVVVIDLGNATADKVHWFWLGADEVVLVTTPEPVAVMDGYATVKTAVGSGVSPETLSLVVNQASGPEEGVVVHRRLDQSVRRFLGRSIAPLGCVVDDPSVKHAARQSVPVVLAAPESPASRAIEAIAAALVCAPAQRANAAA